MNGNNKRQNIVAMVPAKIGSVRLAMKNLALVAGKPLIYYAIKAARDAGVFGNIVLDAEDAVFSAIAKRYGVDFYQRPARLVKPNTKTDVVVYDFIKNNPCDIVAWISPIAPFQTGAQVRKIVDYFVREGLDSLMTVKDEQVHCVYGNKAVNFRTDEIFAQTQDIIPVRAFVYSVMMWRAEVFMKNFDAYGYALVCGKTGYYPVEKLSSLIVKKEEDLMLADYIMRAKSRNKEYRVKYDKVVKKVRGGG